MDLVLEFGNGRITGEGNDNVGPFIISGRYEDAATEEQAQPVADAVGELVGAGAPSGVTLLFRRAVDEFRHGGHETVVIFAKQTLSHPLLSVTCSV
jgi:hypothetical protein